MANNKKKEKLRDFAKMKRQIKSSEFNVWTVNVNIKKITKRSQNIPRATTAKIEELNIIFFLKTTRPREFFFI